MKSKSIIVSILLVITLLIAGTYAAWKIKSSETKINFGVEGLDAFIDYTKGNDILSGELSDSIDYKGGISSSFTLNKNTDDMNIDALIKLNILEIGANLRNDQALKYTLVKGDELSSDVIVTNNFKDNINNNSIIIPHNITLTKEKEEYTLWIWLDRNLLESDNILNENLQVKIEVEASNY